MAGAEWTAVLDVSPDGSLYVEGGTSVAVRSWPEHAAMSLALTPELETPDYCTDGRFLSNTRIVLNQVPSPEVSVVDLNERSITATYQLLDGRLSAS